MQLNCKVKWQPPFLHQPPPFQAYRPFLATFLVAPPAQVTKFLEGSPPQLWWCKTYAELINQLTSFICFIHHAYGA